VAMWFERPKRSLLPRPSWRPSRSLRRRAEAFQTRLLAGFRRAGTLRQAQGGQSPRVSHRGVYF
jgi:hypothetical protein